MRNAALKFFALALTLALPTTVLADAHGSPQTIVDVAAGDPQFSTLVAAVQAAGLAETLSGDGSLTVFAPTNDAFAALGDTVDALLANPELLKQVILYHALPAKYMAADVVGLGAALPAWIETAAGDLHLKVDVADGNVVVGSDGATVIAADVVASNGVIHVVDKVLIPPFLRDNIVDTAAAIPEFSTLVSAVVAADLAGVLAGEGPFTLFAPSQAAFAAMDQDEVARLLLPESKDLLTSILTYHVVPGKVMSYDLAAMPAADLAAIATVEGEALSIDMATGMINGKAPIVATDIEVSNGVIHIIDAVVMPPSVGQAAEGDGDGDPSTPAEATMNVVELLSSSPEHTTLVAAIAAAGLTDTLVNNHPITVFAPTNAAFAALPAGTLDDLLLPENKAVLAALLAYHVVGNFTTTDMGANGFRVWHSQIHPIILESLDYKDGKVAILQIDGTVNPPTVNGNAKITDADHWATNGMVQVIDAVLSPEGLYREPIEDKTYYTETEAEDSGAPLHRVPALVLAVAALYNTLL